MWRAAEDTAGDLLGRLAVVPMVLEARGLDVTPGMIEIFRTSGDAGAIAALETIYGDQPAGFRVFLRLRPGIMKH